MIINKQTLLNSRRDQIVVILIVLSAVFLISIQYYLTLLQTSQVVAYADTAVIGTNFDKHYIPIYVNSSIEGKPTMDDSLQNNNSKPVGRFIIEIDRPGQKLDMPAIRELLKDTGIKLDPGYGPYLVNPKLGHYIVRATGDRETQEKVKQIPGVKLFSDTKVSPF